MTAPKMQKVKYMILLDDGKIMLEVSPSTHVFLTEKGWTVTTHQYGQGVIDLITPPRGEIPEEAPTL